MDLKVLTEHFEEIWIQGPRMINENLIVLHYETVSVVLLMISCKNESNLLHCEKKSFLNIRCVGVEPPTDCNYQSEPDGGLLDRDININLSVDLTHT